MPAGRREIMQRELSAGGELADANVPFPDSRPCRDAAFSILFILIAAGCVGFAAMQFGTVAVNFPSITLLGGGMAAGAGGAFITAVVYMLLMGRAPACVVWTSLIMPPVLAIAIGIALIAGDPETGLHNGGLVVFMALCMLAFAYRARSLIPLTIELVKVLSTVVQENPAMLIIAVVCGLWGLGWSIGVFVTALTIVNHFATTTSGQIQIAIAFLFVFYWGVQTGYYYSHTVLCGVFGRWFYKKNAEAPVCSSIKVASTSSLGSISMAAFIVSLIQTVQFVLRRLRRDAQAGGNVVCCAVFAILECMTRCVDCITGWYNDWALVQVAVRGTGFVDSAKITYSLATCSNMEKIIAALLVDRVAILASLLCAGVGAGVGAAMLYFAGSDGTLVGAGASLGLLPGIMIGNAAGSLVTSGSKTILMSWAEKPEVLHALYPEIAQALQSKSGPFGS